MRKLFLVAALALALPIMAQAQDSPRTEIFGGYSYLRADDDGGNEDQDLNGWNASINQNIIKWLGFKADFSGHYGDLRVLGINTADFNTHLFLFGPQFTVRKSERFQPFGHVLLGVARVDVNNGLTGLDFSDTAFALAVGGGLDVKVIDNLAIRLFQTDYVLTRFGDDNQHNFRASAGLVLRFGDID